MIDWSRRRTLIAGAAVIVLTNAVALLGVAYNRSGEPDSVLQLTQRELHPAYHGWGVHDNSGMALRLDWRLITNERANINDVTFEYSGYGGAPSWLDQAKLHELGFDVSRLEDTERGHRFYARQLPQPTLLVLEYDGAAYQRSLQLVREHAEREEALQAGNPGKKEFEERARHAWALLQREDQSNSRLFVIDAGRDAIALRAKYPDRTRYAIVWGRLRLSVSFDKPEPKVSAYVSELEPSEINIPKAERGAFQEKMGISTPYSTGSYDVTLAFGKRLEPWTVRASRAASR